MKKVTSSVSTMEYTSFEILGRVTGHKQTTDGREYTTGYTYNLSGGLDEETYPTGRVVRNVLDPNGDLSIVQSKKNATAGFWDYASGISYTAAGAVSSLQLGNGHWESTTFNSRLQPMRIALGVLPGGNDLLKLDYSYGDWVSGSIDATKNNGNIVQQMITVPNSPGQSNAFTATQKYYYDPLNRIDDATEEISAAQTWRQDFTYDRYGNRNFVEANTTTIPRNCSGQICALDHKIYNPAINTANNRLSTSESYGFDNAGNTTTDPQSRTFTYDGENKQVSVSGTGGIIGQYFYDGDGKRIKKKAYDSNGNLTEETIFVYDATGRSIAEYSAIDPNQSEGGSAPAVSYLTNDHLGSPRINTDASGAVGARHDYHPFGEEIVTSQRAAHPNYTPDAVRKRFTGYERDGETGLDFAQARAYSSSLGRFTSSDPIHTITFDKLVDPQRSNLYPYTRNSPLKYLDPDGMKIVACTQKESRCGDRQRLTPDEEAQWNLVVTIANLHDGLGNYWFPELHRLYQRLDNDNRTFFIVPGNLPGQAAGQTDITKITPDGKDFAEATITLDFARIKTGEPTTGTYDPKFKKLAGVSGGYKVAEIFGHEAAHMEWNLDNIAQGIELTLLQADHPSRRKRAEELAKDFKKGGGKGKFVEPPDIMTSDERQVQLLDATERYAQQREAILNSELRRKKKK